MLHPWDVASAGAPSVTGPLVDLRNFLGVGCPVYIVRACRRWKSVSFRSGGGVSVG